MSTELNLEARARIHAALGDETRLAVVDALLVTDESPGVLADHLDIAGNLMAHHLGVLEAAGLLTRVTSEADRRRTYLHLRRDQLDGLVPTIEFDAARVVFVCTHNSARSQLAAAVWGQHSDVPVASAGTEPASRVHPRAVATARAHGVRMGRVRPQSVTGVLSEQDLVITVCDTAREQLDAAIQGHNEVAVHWSIPDPAVRDTQAAFESTFEAVTARIHDLAPTVHKTRT